MARKKKADVIPITGSASYDVLPEDVERIRKLSSYVTNLQRALGEEREQYARFEAASLSGLAQAKDAFMAGIGDAAKHLNLEVGPGWTFDFERMKFIKG